MKQLDNTSEMLEVYDLVGNFLKTQPRWEFKEDAEKQRLITDWEWIVGKNNVQVKRAMALILSGEGDIRISKECLQEMDIPTLVVSNNMFLDALDLWLERQCMMTKIERIMCDESTRNFSDGIDFIQPYISDYYLWYYNWSIRFSDWESSGINIMNIEELLENIEKSPDLYTEDLKFLIARYRKYLIASDKFKEIFENNGSTFNI